jgi:hypothetical protein
MNLYQKLVEVKKAVTYLKKEATGHQYNYVSSSQVLGELRQKMNELGLLLVPSVRETKVSEDMVESVDKFNNPKHTTTYFTEIHIDMTWINADNPDERLTSPWYAQGVDIAGEKGVGKAYTYAEKYFLLKFFNIPTDKDDPDAFQRKHDNEPPQKPQPRPQQASGNSKPPVQQTTLATTGQKKTLAAACKQAGMDTHVSFSFMDDTIGHHDTDKITAEEVSRLITALPSYKEVMAQ